MQTASEIRTMARRGGSAWMLAAVLMVALRSQGAMAAYQTSDPEVDGRQLYRSLFLGEGAGAAVLEPYATRTGDEVPAEVADALLQRISLIDSTFFARFSTALRSGDQRLAMNSIHEAAAITNSAASPAGHAGVSGEPQATDCYFSVTFTTSYPCPWDHSQTCTTTWTISGPCSDIILELLGWLI